MSCLYPDLRLFVVVKQIHAEEKVFLCTTCYGRSVICKIDHLFLPSSSNLLPVLLLIGKRVVEMLVDDGEVAGHHGAGTALHKVECLLLTWGVQVIEEDPSYSTSLSSVAHEKVAVTPGRQKHSLAIR